MEEENSPNIPNPEPKKADFSHEKKSNKPGLFKRIQFWQILSVVVIILLVISVISLFSLGNSGATGATVGPTITVEQAKEEARGYIDTILAGRASATFGEVTEEAGLYKIPIDLQGQTFDSYITKDGKIFFPTGVNLKEFEEIAAAAQNTPTTEPIKVPKTDMPEVELFIMSYCPFGLQMEKAILPVIGLLGDIADIQIKFVSYAMHDKKEIDENTRQYCIQKDQSDKLLDYLKCFLEEGKTEECLEEADIDTDMLNTCIEEADTEFKITENYEDKNSWSGGRFPKYDIHAELNEKYGVRGSPTLIINGVQSNAQRTPNAVKEAICNAFNKPPKECEEELSTATTSSGFGFSEATASSIEATCG